MEDRKRDIELIALQLEVLRKTVDPSMAYIAPVDEGEQPHTEEPGHYVDVELASDTPVKRWVDFNHLVCLLLLFVFKVRVHGCLSSIVAAGAFALTLSVLLSLDTADTMTSSGRGQSRLMRSGPKETAKWHASGGLCSVVG